MAKVLVSDEARKASPVRAPASALSLFAPALALGLVLSLVAAIDLSFVWFPLRFGNGEWEFTATSRTFDALSLASVGLLLILAAASLRQSRGLLLALGLVYTALLFCLVGAAVIYALNVPVALGAVPAQARTVLDRAMLRTALLMAVYLPAYVWLTWFTWRQFGAARKEVL
jgi:hypothetical protein